MLKRSHEGGWSYQVSDKRLRLFVFWHDGDKGWDGKRHTSTLEEGIVLGFLQVISPRDSHSSLLHEVSGPKVVGSASVIQERKC